MSNGLRSGCTERAPESLWVKALFPFLTRSAVS